MKFSIDQMKSTVTGSLLSSNWKEWGSITFLVVSRPYGAINMIPFCSGILLQDLCLVSRTKMDMEFSNDEMKSRNWQPIGTELIFGRVQTIWPTILLCAT